MKRCNAQKIPRMPKSEPHQALQCSSNSKRFRTSGRCEWDIWKYVIFFWAFVLEQYYIGDGEGHETLVMPN